MDKAPLAEEPKIECRCDTDVDAEPIGKCTAYSEKSLPNDSHIYAAPIDGASSSELSCPGAVGGKSDV